MRPTTTIPNNRLTSYTRPVIRGRKVMSCDIT